MASWQQNSFTVREQQHVRMSCICSARDPGCLCVPRLLSGWRGSSRSQLGTNHSLPRVGKHGPLRTPPCPPPAAWAARLSYGLGPGTPSFVLVALSDSFPGSEGLGHAGAGWRGLDPSPAGLARLHTLPPSPPENCGGGEGIAAWTRAWILSGWHSHPEDTCTVALAPINQLWGGWDPSAPHSRTELSPELTLRRCRAAQQVTSPTFPGKSWCEAAAAK